MLPHQKIFILFLLGRNWNILGGVGGVELDG